MKINSPSARSWLVRLRTVLRHLRRTDFNPVLVGFGLPVSSDQILIHRRNTAHSQW